MAATMPTAWRLLILAAVLAGLFGMHVLGVEDANGNHVTPSAAAAGGSVSVMADAMPSDVTAGNPGSHQGGHDGMSACILFLVLGGVGLAVGWLVRKLIRQLTEGARQAWVVAVSHRRRGPPAVSDRPRIALCVLRV
jgi:hypothetical protein